MRVIGGQFRSRLLLAPPGTETRPTSDRLRETLFNVLAPRLPDAHFADLYAGSGAVGIEALSRGATSVTFAERAPAALQVLRKNLLALGLESHAQVENGPVHRLLAGGRSPQRWDVIFLDPPYAAFAEYLATLNRLGEAGTGLLAPGAMVVAEHDRRTHLPPAAGRLTLGRVLTQGDAALSFYAEAEEGR